jgi:hypothetical protein
MREIRTFVVRVYRRDARGVSGVVEDVQNSCLHNFHSAADLWAVLESRAEPVPSERKPK